VPFTAIILNHSDGITDEYLKHATLQAS